CAGVLRVDVLPAVNDRDSSCGTVCRSDGFLLLHRLSARTNPLRSSTDSTGVFYLSARPAARMFIAAFASRSWIVPHTHVHALTCRAFLSPTTPHTEHRRVDGNQ